MSHSAGRRRDRTVDDRIFAVTLELLVEKGASGLSVEAVARAAGIGKQSIYRRYDGRLSLMLAVLDELVEDRNAMAAPGAPETSDISAVSVRDALSFAYDFASTEPGRSLLRALLSEAAGCDDAMALIRKRLVDDRRNALIAALARRGGGTGGDAELLADMLLGLVWGQLVFGLPLPDGALERLGMVG